MNQTIRDKTLGVVAEVGKIPGPARVLVVCEHASARIPECLGSLGLSAEVRASHIAWDPGALAVAQAMAAHLAAPLVRGGVSRLVYDCNRPPEAASAIPVRSEDIDIPGNLTLTEAERSQRINGVYRTFHTCLSDQIVDAGAELALIATVHSFTPVFLGQPRDVEIGILHGRDDRFAKAMMATVPEDLGYDTRLNEPYSAADGVAHTLDKHGAANELRSVMIEIRNDLIDTEDRQLAMAARLASWITATLDGLPR